MHLQINGGFILHPFPVELTMFSFEDADRQSVLLFQEKARTESYLQLPTKGHLQLSQRV